MATVRKQPDPIAWLEHAIKIDAPVNSEYMRVSLEGNDPTESKIILEHLRTAYLADVDLRDNGAKRTRLKTLEDTTQKYRKDVEDAHKRMDIIAVALGTKDEATLMTLDAILRDELRLAQRDLQTATENVALTVSSPPGAKSLEEWGPVLTLPWNLGTIEPVPPIPPAESRSRVEAETRQDAHLKLLDEAVVASKERLNKVKERYQEGEQAPAITKAENDLKAAEQKRDKYRDELQAAAAIIAQKKYAQQELQRRAEFREKVETLEKREKIAKGKIEEIIKRVSKTNDYKIELDGLKLSIGQTEKLNQSLGETIARLRVELGAPPRVSCSEDPFIVTGLEGNRRLKFTVLAALAVFGLGLAGAIGWETRARRVIDTDDVTKALGVRLLGTVPVAGQESSKSGRPAPSLVEAIDATRTMLVHGTDEPDLRVFVVTSAVSGEGKTSLTGHLAISLARAGFRTLLVDGDLRAPTVHRVFDAPLAPGLCEILRGSASIAEAVRPTGIPGLSALTAGQWTLATRHAIVGDRWRVTKDELKSNFDFVIVDTSPLLLVSDTLLLAREADGVVVSVLMGVSQIALVDEAVARLLAVRAKVTGVIANGVRHAAHAYTHGYGTIDPIDHNVPAPAIAAGPATTERE
ncbi:tyrosine-protein kinase domain-containing protein [Gemmata massiliana]|uniref:tyrosine-protein kinase domain-containing protein n=1 Tax=Gemmata massiliana TaxID=1210884 RepID=UPI0013A6B307|nr:CpsD/CapB family tyrosine-protein kinase [Gemmata massiliana]